MFAPGDLAVGARRFRHNVSFYVFFMAAEGNVRNVSKVYSTSEFFAEESWISSPGRSLAMSRIGSSLRFIIGDDNAGDGDGSVAVFTMERSEDEDCLLLVQDFSSISVGAGSALQLSGSGFGSSVIFLEENTDGTFQACVGASRDDDAGEDSGAIWDINVETCSSSPENDDRSSIRPVTPSDRPPGDPGSQSDDSQPPEETPRGSYDKEDSKQRKTADSNLVIVAALLTAVLLFCCCLSVAVFAYRRVRRHPPVRQADPASRGGAELQTLHAKRSRHVSWAPSVSLRNEDARFENVLKTHHKAQPPKISALVGCQLPEFDGESDDDATPAGRRSKLLV